MNKLWWEHITKAHKFMEDIVSAALAGKSMIVSLPANVPWRSTLIELVEDNLHSQNPNNGFDEVKCPEEEVGHFLLEKYCKKERRATYRYGMSYASFLGQCEDTVLNDHFIWVSDIPENKYDEWISFIVEYNNNVKNKVPAIFILETSDNSFAMKAKKGMEKIIFDQNIGIYDIFAFCTLAATENSCKEYLRPYLAELVSTLCKDDVELCAECVKKGNVFLKDPLNVIKEITSSEMRSNGELYTFSKSDDEMRSLIWEAQIKSVFPVIERYRSWLIKKYHGQIEKGLPITNSFGETISKPEDVELGMIVLLAGKSKILIESHDYDELVRFKDARNSLAHLDILQPGVVNSILWRGDSLQLIKDT